MCKLKYPNYLLMIAITYSIVFCASCTNNNSKKTISNYESKNNLITNYNIGCIGEDEIKNIYSPVDLYKGLLQCMKMNNYKDAAFLFAIAGTYATFDKKRVEDRSAHQAHSVLTLQLYQAVTKKKYNILFKKLQVLLSSPEGLSSSCNIIRKIGAPDYHPVYMIQHGIGSFMNSSLKNGIIPNFNSIEAWNDSLKVYLHCKS